jgi:hypothetical protein
MRPLELTVVVCALSILFGCEKAGQAGDDRDTPEQAECMDLGELDGSASFNSDVEGGHGRCYRVSLANDGAITIVLQDDEPFGTAVELYGGDVEKKLLNHDNALRAVPSRDGGMITAALPRGTHVVNVYGTGEFGLTLDFEPNGKASPQEDPSENPDGAALSLSVTEPTVVGGYVGPLDAADVYRVEVSEAGTLSFSVPDSSGAFAQTLYTVGADDGAFQESEKLAELPSRDGTSLERVVEPGVYYLKVHGDSVYTLVADFVPLDAPMD